MKKCIVLLVLLMFSNVGFAEEIKLDVNTPLGQNINLETPNQAVLESCPQKLENKGFLLQNSIAPVRGLKYNSQVIIPDSQPVQQVKSVEKENKMPPEDVQLEVDFEHQQIGL